MLMSKRDIANKPLFSAYPHLPERLGEAVSPPLPSPFFRLFRPHNLCGKELHGECIFYLSECLYREVFPSFQNL